MVPPVVQNPFPRTPYRLISYTEPMAASTMSEIRVLSESDYQRKYYQGGRKLTRIAPSRSWTVMRHLQRALDALALPPGSRLVEIGCGMGRFSRILAERGYRIVATDLSQELLGLIPQIDEPGKIDVVCCDASMVDRHVVQPVHGVTGFFVLHHLPDLDRAFSAIARLLEPGSPVVWVEPNGFNPLFPIQILLSRGMTWRGDGGVVRMRPGILVPALLQAGFGHVRIRRYGFFPPALANTRLGRRFEDTVDRLTLPRALPAFQVISAVRV